MSPGMLGGHKRVQLITLLAGAIENPLVDFVWKRIGATEDPQVFPVRFTYDRPTIAGVEIDYPIVAIEGPEKGHLQLAVGTFLVGQFRSAVDAFFGSIGLAAFIDDRDLSIRADLIGRGGVAHAFALEPVGQPRQFKPFSGIFWKVEGRNGL